MNIKCDCCEETLSSNGKIYICDNCGRIYCEYCVDGLYIDDYDNVMACENCEE